MADRRRLHRWKRSVSCEFKIAGGLYRGLVDNLSLSGLRVCEAEEVPSLKQHVAITVAPEDEAIKLEGEVVYVSATSFGVRLHGPRGSLMRKLSPLREDR